jgi:AcrR family transcriptional regulator
MSPRDIAVEALRQFDEHPEPPSMRKLAAALGASPSAIYHHFPSQAALVRAVVDLVWEEAMAEVFAMVGDPLRDDPADVLVAVGIGTRRAFCRHYRVAPYMAASPESDELRATMLAFLAGLFERLDLAGDDAALPFHAFASYTVGTTLFAATRHLANEQVGAPALEPESRFRSDHDAEGASLSSERTRRALDSMMDLSVVDPAEDEAVFAGGLRRLIESFRPQA